MSENIDEEYRELLLDYAELCEPYEVYEEYLKTAQIELCNELSVKAYELLQRAPEREDLKIFWKNTTELAQKAAYDGYPENYEENIELTKKGDLSGLESLVQFLEQDQWFFRSGYAKAYLINVIKKVTLSDDYRERLRALILRVVDFRDRREFRHFCKLARLIQNHEFKEQLIVRLKSEDPGVRRRARWVLEAINRR